MMQCRVALAEDIVMHLDYLVSETLWMSVSQLCPGTVAVCWPVRRAMPASLYMTYLCKTHSIRSSGLCPAN